MLAYGFNEGASKVPLPDMANSPEANFSVKN